MIATCLLLGPSGAGKTSSTFELAKQMHDKVFFINSERKDLPYPADFKYKKRPKTTTEVLNLYDQMIAGAAKEGIQAVVHDSFSAYIDLALYEARRIFTNYDIWNDYNDKIGKLFMKQKDLADAGIHSFMIAHDEVVADEGSALVKRATKVKGKEWEAVIEKEFNIVLWSEAVPKEDNIDEIEYRFMTNTNGKIPAKSPRGMFEKYIPNDLFEVIKALDNYGKPSKTV